LKRCRRGEEGEAEEGFDASLGRRGGVDEEDDEENVDAVAALTSGRAELGDSARGCRYDEEVAGLEMAVEAM
jgi:hypothetical protein